MDVQKFAVSLPRFYQDWGLSSVYPVSPVFPEVLDRVGGSTTATVLQLLNAAVGCLAADEVYCEVGCLEGAHLIAALQGHPNRMAYAVESPTRLDLIEGRGDRLLANLVAFGLDEQVFFCCQDTEVFFAELGEAGLEDRIGVYFYNGAADYRSLLLGLLQAKPFLAEQALIVLGQAGLGTVRQATWDFLTTHPQAKLLLDQSTNPGFGCGLLVLEWDGTHLNNPATSNPISESTVPINSPPINSPPISLLRREPTVIDAIYSLDVQQRAISLEQLRQSAAQCVVEGQLKQAEHKYGTILLYNGGNADVWQNLGMVRYLAGKNEAALHALEMTLQFRPGDALAHHISGLVWERMGQVEAAIAAQRQAITYNPTYADGLNSLGNLVMSQGALPEAEDLFRRAIAAAPSQPIGYENLGDGLMRQNRQQEAIAEYRHAINLNRQSSHVWQKLIAAYRAVGDSARAELYTIYALYFQNLHEEAIQQFETHLTLDQLQTSSDCLILHDCYVNCGHTEQAIQCAEAAARLCPEDAFLQNLPSLVLPLIYQSPEEIELYRQRYLNGYERLTQQVEQAFVQGTAQETVQNLSALETFVNFYITYQGYNDRAIHAVYGNLRHQRMAARYPDLVQPLAMPPLGQNGKIRIGYIAEALGNSSETRWAVGWLKHCDRSQFEIYCYSIGATTDLRTEQFRLLSDAFYQLPEDLDAICQQIRADQLHILVFLALGIRTRVTSIASLRLAPVQCGAWGHPVTSGLPTIDYFLSSQLMEPENGQEHYTERLVRLPNLGLCYPKPHHPTPSKTRTDFGLAEDAVVYLSCQLVFKYLPQHDDLFVEIARRLPKAHFVFVLRSTISNRSNPSLERAFQQRLRRAFAKAGLNLEDFCTFLPGQDSQGYASLLACADVFLDTLSFSGGHTTFDAIACNLPVVCCPGNLMRGRQSAAVLQMLGETDTIAPTETAYIDIAVKLGLEPEWRREIGRQMGECHPNLFEDKICVAGLEQFYRQVVQEQLASPDASPGEAPSSHFSLPSN